MTDKQLDHLIAAAAPFDTPAVVALDLHGAEHSLLEEIMSTSTTDLPEPASREPAPQPTRSVDRQEPPSTGRRRTRRWATALAVAAVLLGAVLLPRLWSANAPSGSGITQFSLAARQVAEANPRLLVEAPGWRVSHVDEFDSTEGEMRFSAGARELQVNWRRADTYGRYVADRSEVSAPRTVRVLGAVGQMFTYSPRDFAVILPVQGAVFLELRGGVGDRSAFVQVLRRLRTVGVDTWLAAMPASVVTAKEQGRVAAQMLADVPMPPGLDTAQLADGDTSDYYQYGARVTGHVVCAWIQDWRTARTRRDRAGMREAATALVSSHHWRVLRRMDVEGDYPEVVWEIADQVSAGTLPAEYRQGLGCE